MKNISRILLIILSLANFSLNASSAPFKRAATLFSKTVNGIQNKLKAVNFSKLKEVASVFTKENAQRAHTLLNLSLLGYAAYTLKENYPQRMTIDDYWVSAELKDQILANKRRQAHQLLTVLGVTATGIIQATQHLPINQKNKVYSLVLTSFLTTLNLKKWLPEGVSEQYDNIKAVIHEYPKTLPAVPEGFKKVDPATTKDSISITWDLENFPKPESIQLIEQEKLEEKSFKKAQEIIENIIRSCNYSGMYIIRAAKEEESSSTNFYAWVEQMENLIVISLSQIMIGDIKTQRRDSVFTVWHEMGHVIWKHGPESRKNIFRKMAYSKENNILYHFFSRSKERQANNFAFQNIDTLELENTLKYFKEKTHKKIFKEKITDFFSRTHPDLNEEREAAQEELRKRKIKTPRFYEVVAAETTVRNRKLW